MTLYKVLNEDMSCCHGGTGTWKLGEWKEVKGMLVMCENGLHLCNGEEQLLNWLYTVICTAEYEGERLDGDNKICVRRARVIRKLDTWNERTARLFACDCNEHILNLFEERYPDDERPRQTIEVARRYANGDATKEELDAARNVARATARGAAAVAEDVAWSAAATVAEGAGWAAVTAAATARTAAAAAEVTERKWQAKRLRWYLEG